MDLQLKPSNKQRIETLERQVEQLRKILFSLTTAVQKAYTKREDNKLPEEPY